MDSGTINCFISHKNTFYSVLNMCTAIDLSKAEHRLPAAYLRVIPTDLAPGKSLPAPATVRVLELPVPAGRVEGAHRYSVGIFDLPTDT